MYDEWASLAGADCAFETKGAMYLYRTAKGLAEGRHEIEMMAEAGLHPCVLDGGRSATWFRRYGRGWRRDRLPGGRAPGTAFVRAGAGAPRRAQRRGFFDNEEALGFETSGRKVTTVRTTRGDVHPDQVCWRRARGRRRWRATWTCGFPSRRAKGYSLTFRRPDPCPELPCFSRRRRLG